MLDNFVKQIGQELGIEKQIASPEAGIFKIPITDEILVEASLTPVGHYFFKGIIGNCPNEHFEDFLLRVMEANLFGKGTYGATIGLTDDEKMLTLSMEVDYNAGYKEWEEKLEDFVNVTAFWKRESLGSVKQ
jgi:hypothetical protein